MSARAVCIVLVLALGAGAAACRSTVGGGGDPCVGDPDVAVMELRSQWESAPCQ